MPCAQSSFGVLWLVWHDVYVYVERWLDTLLLIWFDMI